jgi:drug/metabolite transporter (DMT)-like permease
VVRAFALLLLAVLLWGVQPLVVKIALGVFSVGFAAFARAVTAAAFFGLVALLSRLRRAGDAPSARSGSSRPALWLVIGGMGMGLGTVLWNARLMRTTVGASSVLQMGGNLLVVLYGITILRERCGPLRAAGLLLTLSGLFVVSWNGESLSALLSSRYFQGNMMALAAGAAWGLASIAQKVTVQGRSSISVSAVIFAFAALTCGAAAIPGPALVVEFSPLLLVALLLTGLLGMGLGNVLFTESMRTITVSVGAALSAASPLISLIAAARLLHEPVSAYLLIGAPATCLGVTAAIVSEPSKTGALRAQ